MLLNQPLNPPNLGGPEAPAALKTNWTQLELCRVVVPFDANLRRLIPITGVEEEAVGARAQHRRHRLTLPEASGRDEITRYPFSA